MDVKGYLSKQTRFELVRTRRYGNLTSQPTVV